MALVFNLRILGEIYGETFTGPAGETELVKFDNDLAGCDWFQEFVDDEYTSEVFKRAWDESHSYE